MIKRLFLHYIAEEARPMIRLALPLVLAELGWMTMAIVDTMMVGRQADSAVAIGAVSLGSILFNSAAIFGTGLMLGLDTLVSHSYGAGDVEDCHRVAGQRRVSQFGHYSGADGRDLAVRAALALARYSGVGFAASNPVFTRAQLGHAAAAALFRFPPLSCRA